VIVGVQWIGSLAPGQTRRWFTYNWPQQWHVVWVMQPTSPQAGAPQISWDVAVERASTSYVTYWVTVRNLSASAVTFEGRYAILNN
jgi:hypothetical protein